MNPKKFCVNFNPPRLCLIYDFNHEEFFHEFLFSQEDLAQPSKKLVKQLKEVHQGYLDQIEDDQIIGLIERIKKESKNKTEQKTTNPKNAANPKNAVNPGKEVAKPAGKISSVDKFREMMGSLGISDSDYSSSDEDNVDYNAVENNFEESDEDY